MMFSPIYPEVSGPGQTWIEFIRDRKEFRETLMDGLLFDIGSIQVPFL